MIAISTPFHLFFFTHPHKTVNTAAPLSKSNVRCALHEERRRSLSGVWLRQASMARDWVDEWQSVVYISEQKRRGRGGERRCWNFTIYLPGRNATRNTCGVRELHEWQGSLLEFKCTNDVEWHSPNPNPSLSYPGVCLAPPCAVRGRRC